MTSDPEIEAVTAEVPLSNDAAYGPGDSPQRRPLRNISEVRHFFRTNDVPIFFFGRHPVQPARAGPLGTQLRLHHVLRRWDGAHPRVFTPKDKPYIEFESGEEINNWLLTNPEVRAYIASRGRGVRPKVAMVFFDNETEKICKELGYDLILPSAAAARTPGLQDRHHPAGQRGRRAERAERPDPVDDWEGLSRQRRKGRARHELVVQTPYGDSGKTTFFLDQEADWHKHSDDIVGEQQSR